MMPAVLTWFCGFLVGALGAMAAWAATLYYLGVTDQTRLLAVLSASVVYPLAHRLGCQLPWWAVRFWLVVVLRERPLP